VVVTVGGEEPLGKEVEVGKAVVVMEGAEVGVGVVVKVGAAVEEEKPLGSEHSGGPIGCEHWR